jgi:hypothetical protein
MNRLINALLFLAPFLLAEALCRFMPVASMPMLSPVTAGAPVVHMQPNVEYTYSRDWNFSIHHRKRSNNFGYVNQVDYQPDAPAPLLAVIGDSYVEAQGIPAGGNLAEVLNQRVSPKGRVYSIGLSGAPLSQYMVFAQFARDTFHPAAMAFVIINNDFDESLLKYKSDPRFHYFDASGELRRVDYEMSTLKKILRHSAFMRYVVLNLQMERAGETIRAALRPSAAPMLEERTEDSKKAIVCFLDQLPPRAGLPANSIVFVLDAVRPAIYSPEALQKVDDGYHARMRRYFTEQATARGYNVIDMQPVFIARNRSDGSRFELLPTDSHWNAAANRLAADEMEKSAPFARLFGTSAVARSH